jgi:hypothetical protein
VARSAWVLRPNGCGAIFWSGNRSPGSPRRQKRYVALPFLALVLSLSSVRAQDKRSSTPVNDLPNPYQTVEHWAKFPEGRIWGSTSAVEIDRDGKSIWVAARCGANSCGSSTLPALLKFDQFLLELEQCLLDDRRSRMEPHSRSSSSY